MGKALGRDSQAVGDSLEAGRRVCLEQRISLAIAETTMVRAL